MCKCDRGIQNASSMHLSCIFLKKTRVLGFVFYKTGTFSVMFRNINQSWLITATINFELFDSPSFICYSFYVYFYILLILWGGLFTELYLHLCILCCVFHEKEYRHFFLSAYITAGHVVVWKLFNVYILCHCCGGKHICSWWS